MSEKLFQNMSLIAGSEGGVRRLREFILQLAMMGKLVPQDITEEPAAELLKKIKALNKSEKVIDSAEPVCRYPIPTTWEWAKLGVIATQVTDGTHHTPTYTAEGVPFLSVKDVSSGRLNFSNTRFISESEHKALCKRCKPQYGDVLLTKVGTTGIAVVVDAKTQFSIFVSLALIKMPLEIDSRFLALQLNSPFLRRQSAEGTEGVGNKNLVLRKINNFDLVIPPQAEQRRIVSKVDELMSLCDLLEAQQNDATTVNTYLVKALLDTLCQNTNGDFDSIWNQVKQYFDVLFSTESSVDALIQTLLHLAVMGKLVRQDPDHETASSLLERIRAEKSRLEQSGTLKKEKPLDQVSASKMPYGLPASWAWSKIGDCVLFTEYGISEKTFSTTDGVPVIKMGDIQHGQVLLGGQKKAPREAAVIFLRNQDLLYNRTNSAELVGKTGIFEGPDEKYTFASYLIRIQCIPALSEPRYLNLAMNAPSFRRTQILPHLKQQCGQANVNGTVLKNMLVPIPPLEEQRLIVAKVAELVSLCEKLKNILRKSAELEVLVATALIDKALATNVITEKSEIVLQLA